MILITGVSGSGKSRSLKDLDPNQGLFCTPLAKPVILIRGAKKLYPYRENGVGNRRDFALPIERNETIEPTTHRYFSIARKNKLKYIVFDDINYALLNIENDLSKTMKDGRQIYKFIKAFIVDLFRQAQLAELNGIETIIIWHKAKNYDSLIIPGVWFAEESPPEGWFPIVLQAEVTPDDKYTFRTNGFGLPRSPEEMLPRIMPNDITKVLAYRDAWDEGMSWEEYDKSLETK